MLHHGQLLPSFPSFLVSLRCPFFWDCLCFFFLLDKPSCLRGPVSWGLRGREAAHSWTGQCMVLTVGLWGSPHLTSPHTHTQPPLPNQVPFSSWVRLQSSRVRENSRTIFLQAKDSTGHSSWALTLCLLSRPVEEVFPPRSELEMQILRDVHPGYKFKWSTKTLSNPDK